MAEYRTDQNAAPVPYWRMFERLRDELTGYEFNDKLPPFHSSYDNWHFLGRRKRTNTIGERKASATSRSGSRPSSIRTRSDYDATTDDDREKDVWVVARVSQHVLRLEREFKLCQSLYQKSDHDRKRFVRPLEFARLPPRRPGDKPLCVSIAEAPGRNYLRELVVFAPSFYSGSATSPLHEPNEQVPLLTFLQFALGACESLEVLHHGHQVVHGEIRGDAFHYNAESGVVRLIHFGSGARNFEHGLSSANWGVLMAQRGVEHKLQFLAPEQTGRLPAEPDARSDIYSLGIVFWSMLTGQRPFEGTTPLDVMQNLLSRRIPMVSTVRPDVPEALAKVLAKMTARSMNDRYNAVSGIIHDLRQLKQILEAGDQAALSDFVPALTDVSCIFNMPNSLVGRAEHRKRIIEVIGRAAHRSARAPPLSRRGLYSLSSGSSAMSGDRLDHHVAEDIMSDDSSSTDRDARLNSVPEINPHTQKIRRPSSERAQRHGSIVSSAASTAEHDEFDAKSLENKISVDSRVSTNLAEAAYRTTSLSLQSTNGNEPISLLRSVSKMNRKGKTEIIAIHGAAGFGKSSLVQDVQSEARQHGYFTSAKFDQMKRAPFDPIVRIMAALFRQIFSENDVNTPFHENIRTFVKPFWPMLHVSLELPVWLLQPATGGKIGGRSSIVQQSLTPVIERKSCNAASNQDWLRSGGHSSSRFVHIFSDVLRLLAVQKFVCFCLDDLQFADQESLDLILHIYNSQIPVVLILTYREEELIPLSIRHIVDRGTRVEVGPFTDEDTAQFVSETLHRPLDYCTPLVAIVQEKSQGNPFFVREILDAAHRQGCVYYCWKCSHWEFDLDKLFAAFSSPDSDRFSTNSFILRRIRELPVDAQTVLAWGSVIGNTFSFTLVKRVMSCSCSRLVPQHLIPPTSKDAVIGLQAALSSFMVMTTEEDDKFKFSHDRYVTAADLLCEAYVKAEMHYVIACSMLLHEPYDPLNHSSKVLFDQARHICEALDVIKVRAEKKSVFRDLLYQAAEAARESGARASVLHYLKACLALLPPDPWDDPSGDATYAEVMTLLTRAAEAYWHAGNDEEARTRLSDIIQHATDASDAVPAVIIRVRMLADRADYGEARDVLAASLVKLGATVSDLSWEDCDKELDRLIPQLLAKPPDLSEGSRQKVDKRLRALGALLVELTFYCFWHDTLRFYQSTLVIMKMYLEKGIFPQAALGFVNLGAIAVWRLDRASEAIEFSRLALNMFEAFESESYTVARGLTMHAVFLGHVNPDPRGSVFLLNRGLEFAAGDKLLHLANLGFMAAFRLWTTDNIAEVEPFITTVEEEFPLWQQDFNRGPFLMGTRQYARALQGRTRHRSAHDVLCDDGHSSDVYLQAMATKTFGMNLSSCVYQMYRLVAMYHFGHYKEAVELGLAIAPTMDSLLCMRYSYTALLFFALAIFAVIREQPNHPDRQALLDRAANYRRRYEVIVRANPHAFVGFIEMFDAQVDDLNAQYGDVLAHYESAINNATVAGNAMDVTLFTELYADWLVRRGATRPARSLLMDAVAGYRRVGAYGKADHLASQHEFLLYGTHSLSKVHSATQTDGDLGLEPSYSVKLEKITNHQAIQTSADRTVEWLEPQHEPSTTVPYKTGQPAVLSSAVGLDMIDLAGILESSQLLSSELNVDRLLSKLTSIIVDSTGAELVHLVVESDDGDWCVAAVGSPDGIDAPSQGIPLDKVEDPIAQKITLYVLRFKEQVLLRNVLDDERFSNVPDSWREKNPAGASICGIPILHGDNVLLGSLYCQAPPNTFTERTVTLLKLLVNQIAISIANALLFKRAEKVQATNLAMLEVQKQALDQAREAEKKAKAAEANAMNMVRLKDEAYKARSLFLANVSHELRTPLGGVIGMSELLKNTRLTKEQEEHADSIRVCADTLLSIINDILDYSKLENSKLQIFSVPLSLTQTIKEVVRALSFTNIERNLETIQELEIDPDLVVMGDPVRLHQVLMNLLSNAFKFTAKGSITVRARTDSETADDVSVTVSVTDTGIGVSEEHQKKLFKPFSQADSSTARSYGGTGLGLSICKAIIEGAMKGKIWLTSKPGIGTTVFFSLTFKKVKNGELPPTLSNGREADPMAKFTSPVENDSPGARPMINLAGIPRDRLRVCVAEDNPINQKIAISFVKKLGFHCEAFGDGQQAVDALGRASAQNNPFHIVLMDVQMPVLDGYNATREIRKHPDPRVRDILVIAMTASAIRGDREKCLEAGMNNYLAKPVRADTLKQMLESYLRQQTKPIPDLQQQANQVVNHVVSEAAMDEEKTSSPSSPSPSSQVTPTNQPPDKLENYIPSDTAASDARAKAAMRAQMQAVERQVQELQAVDALNKKALGVQPHTSPTPRPYSGRNT